ncbi:MAG: ABC transporter substrate binding protein [Alcanivoracaceae bacterium]|nr:ABC transporter substrate binding protein [Alcanivoracaceae bacterium]
MVAAGEGPLRVFLSGPASDALTAFEQGLSTPTSSVSITESASQADILLPVGDGAFAAVSSGSPVFAVRVSRRVLDQRRADGCRCSGIYAGARPSDQLALVEALLPRARRVGVVLSRQNRFLEKELAEAAADRIALRVEIVDSAEQLPVALSRLLPAVDVLLLLPDPMLFNAETARLLLLTSYRQGRPVVGPDNAFVRAGSLASIDASTRDVVSHTLAVLEGYTAGRLPPPDYAARTISINPHVARTYGVRETDTEALAESIWGQQ